MQTEMLKSLALIVAGIIVLLWMSDGLAGSDTASGTMSPSVPIQPDTPVAADRPAGSPGKPEVSAQGETPRTYRVPIAVLAELQQESAEIEVQKHLARQLESQLEEARSALAEQKARAEVLEQQLNSLKQGIDQARSHLDASDGNSVFQFNNRVAAYDQYLKQVREQWKKANALDEPFNDLATKIDAQYHLVNQMVDAYNEKIRQIGH